MDTKLIEQLLHFNQKAKELGKQYPKKRYYFEKILAEKDHKTSTGISGLRGVGKTVILCQLLNQIPNSFYISCDSLKDINLYELSEFLGKNYHLDYLLLDEVHFYKNWEKDLKMIYDFLPIKIYFTSSVSLNILSPSYDLVRRVTLVELPIFSFREYLDFKYEIKLPSFDLKQIINDYPKIWKRYFDKEAYFPEYLSQPLPFMLKEPSEKLVRQIVAKIIEKDLFYAGEFTSSDIEAMRNILNFIANTPIAQANYSILSKNLGITKYKAKQYIEFLEKGYLLRSLFPYSSSVIKEPKIVLTLPFRSILNYRLNKKQLQGGLREEFFIQAVSNSVEKIYYLKSTRGAKTPDYLIFINDDKYIFEIGGRKKGFSQFKSIKEKTKKMVVSSPGIIGKDKIPLMLFGLM